MINSILRIHGTLVIIYSTNFQQVTYLFINLCDETLPIAMVK